MSDTEPIKVHAEKPVFPERSLDQAFVMVLCVVFAVPIIFGAVPKPGAIELALPTWLGYLWALTLAIGALIVLFSYLVQERVIAIIIEQFGSILLGMAAFFYGLIILILYWDSGGAISGAIVLGFSLTRLWQAWRYQKFLQKVRAVVDLAKEVP